MINGKTIVAIITARGGSKGLPNKNILDLRGKPLLAWSIDAAKASRYIDRCILSSDADSIMAVAQQHGCEVPFKRPAELARDDTSGTAPVLHALQQLPQKYDYVILLQPTSPLRTGQHLDAAIEMIANADADTLVSVTEPDKPPYWMFNVVNGRLQPLFGGNYLKTRRQELPKSYVVNGAIYIAKTDYLLQHDTFFAESTLAYAMSKADSVDIDTADDLEAAGKLLDARAGFTG